MRTILKLSCLILPLFAVSLFALGQGKTPVVPTSRVPAVDSKPRDDKSVPESAQPIYYSAARALEWLKLTNKPDGHFVYGFQPALRVRLDGDNLLSQAGATFALARAARYFRDPRGAAIAKQAALTLVNLEWMDDPEDKSVRYPVPPPSAINRLSANGMMLSAIFELPGPESYKDLLDQADRLANYLRKQQRDDGSLFVAVGNNVIHGSSDEADADHAGWALQGIIRSHKHRPAEWKLDLLRKARPYYHTLWQGKKNLSTVCSHTPAYAEAYVQTRDPDFADTVFKMNDWLIDLQYREDADSSRKHWTGGFPARADRKDAPDISSALTAESLADACRVAKHFGDLPRLQRYERALLINLHFLRGLQYTPAKAEHFVDAFRPSILGAFHASHHDGNLRIDYTQHALCAMVQYLEGVVE